MLTDREVYVKHFIEAEFLPYLTNLIKEENLPAYYHMEGVFPEQATVCSYDLLNEMLPDYNWEAWEGQFLNPIVESSVFYQHIWLYGEHQEEGSGMLIDLTPRHHEPLFAVVKSNEYPEHHSAYKQLLSNQRRPVPIDILLKDKEPLTRLSYKRIVQHFKKTRNFYSFMKALNQLGRDGTNFATD